MFAESCFHSVQTSETLNDHETRACLVNDMVLHLLAIPVLAGVAASHAAAGSAAIAGGALAGHAAATSFATAGAFAGGHAIAGSYAAAGAFAGGHAGASSFAFAGAGGTFAAAGPWAGAHLAPWAATPWVATAPFSAASWGPNAFNWGLGLGLVGGGVTGLAVGAGVGYAASRPRGYYAPYY
jgi:hypothetical protein